MILLLPRVYIAYLGRKKDMHRLAESDLNFIRDDMLARRQNPDGIYRPSSCEKPDTEARTAIKNAITIFIVLSFY